MTNNIEIITKTIANSSIGISGKVKDFLKNTSDFDLNLEKGVVYEKVGDIEYSAIPSLFYGIENILHNYEYPTLADQEKERKYFLPFAEDISGRNLFFICLKKTDFGKIIFHEADYLFDETFKQGTWVISHSITQFLSQLIQLNPDKPETTKIQEILKRIL